MAKATTTKTTATATQLDAAVTNLSNEVLPPIDGDTEIAVGELKSNVADTDATTTDSNAPEIETYTITHPIDADTQAVAQGDTQDNTAKVSGYKVQWQLRHNGKVYQAGDSVALSEAEAQALLPTGVIVTA